LDLTLVVIFFISLLSAFVDISCGMGYGFTVTPILLLLGYLPQEAVPSVLFASFLGASLSALFHHLLGNADFSSDSGELKIGLVLGGLGVIGGVIGAKISLGIPSFYLQLYIGILVLIAGIFVLLSKGINMGFDWGRITLVGLLGSINKGISGSGFGPIITTGAIISGMDEKTSIAIQALSELPVSLIGFITYYLSGAPLDWQLTLSLGVGVALAAPMAAFFLQRVNADKVRLMIGAVALLIGSMTLIRLFI
jgi:uncharacterized membrane protein YfcA